MFDVKSHRFGFWFMKYKAFIGGKTNLESGYGLWLKVILFIWLSALCNFFNEH